MAAADLDKTVRMPYNEHVRESEQHVLRDKAVEHYWWVVVWRPYGLTLWAAGGTTFTSSLHYAQLFGQKEASERVLNLKRLGFPHFLSVVPLHPYYQQECPRPCHSSLPSRIEPQQSVAASIHRNVENLVDKPVN